MADKETAVTVQEGWEDNLWITSKGLEIPLDIEPPIEAIQSFLELVNNILDFSLFLLDFVKAFVSNFLNPLLSLIRQIITLLKGLLQDLKQIGVYFTSDFALFDDHNKLLGGYPAFERRMMARLSNEEDVNRPNFSPQSACIALYFYGDTAFSNISISDIIEAIQKFIGFFSPNKKPRRIAQPTNISASAVKIRENIISEPTEDGLQLTWQVATSANAAPVGGFIIEISTVSDGFYLAYDAEVKNANSTVKDGTKRVRGLVQDSLTKKNVKIFGGRTLVQNIKSSNEVKYKLVADPTSATTYDIDKLKSEGACQRTYFVPVYPLSMDNSKDWSVIIKYADLPEATDLETGNSIPRNKVAVRIMTVTKGSRKKIEKLSGFDEQGFASVREPQAYHTDLKISYNIDIKADAKGRLAVKDPKYVPVDGLCATLMVGGDAIEHSPPSLPIKVNVAGVSNEFREMCFGVVAMAILRGYDISDQNPALAEMMKVVNMEVMGMQTSKRYKDGGNFGKRLKRDINDALDKAFERVTCTETIQQTLMDVVLGNSGLKQKLTETQVMFFKSDIGFLFGNTRQLFKKFPSRKNREIQQGLLNKRFKKMKANYASETPCFLGKFKDTVSRGSKTMDTSKILIELAQFFAIPNSLNVIDQQSDDKGEFDNEEEAFILTVLNLLFGSMALDSSSDWACFRLFPAGIGWVEDTFNVMINFLESVEETLEAFGKKILKAIAAIEEKIKRIQQIIEIIDRFLEMLKGFTLELQFPLYALVHTANGTDDLVAKLLSSGAKPQANNPTETHAAGMLMLAGGVPSILLEIIVKLLVAEEE